MTNVGALSSLPDTELGKYELVRRLAVGGMAEIFLARVKGIEEFEKLVVLKRILPQFAADEQFLRMFLREARLAASLHHSNIAQVYDFGKVGSSYFFTMEYVHGVDVRQIVKVAALNQKPVPLEHALSIITAIAAGLHYAHEKKGPDGALLGIVHRDVSPSNILVDWEGGVKLVDFGIAKPTAQRSETRPGTLMGKVAYMSPEQCLGETLDRRSDIFALGVVLHELTTGKPLFRADSELLVMKQITEDPIPLPSMIKPNFAPELERIIMRTLARRPEDRWNTGQELQLALEDFAREQRLATSPVLLARYLTELFGEDPQAWQSGKEERAYTIEVSPVEPSDEASSGPVARSGGLSGPTNLVTVKGNRPVELTPLRSDGQPVLPSLPAVPVRSSIGRKVLLMGLVMSALGVVLAIALWIRTPRHPITAATPARILSVPPTETAPQPMPIPVPAVPAQEPKKAAAMETGASTIAVRLRGAPVGAYVVLDGQRQRKNPVVIERSSRLRRLVIRAAGYRDQTIDFVPTQNLELGVSLTRSRAQKGVGRGARATTRRTPAPEPADPRFVNESDL